MAAKLKKFQCQESSSAEASLVSWTNTHYALLPLLRPFIKVTWPRCGRSQSLLQAHEKEWKILLTNIFQPENSPWFLLNWETPLQKHWNEESAKSGSWYNYWTLTEKEKQFCCCYSLITYYEALLSTSASYIQGNIYCNNQFCNTQQNSSHMQEEIFSSVYNSALVQVQSQKEYR